MHDARIQRAVNLEAAVGEHLEHLAIVAQHVGFEFLNSICGGDEIQMIEQKCADTVALEFVADRKCDLCSTWIGAANVASDADEALAPLFCQRRRQPDVIVEIELGQALEIVCAERSRLSPMKRK